MVQLIKDVVWLSEDYSCNGFLLFGVGFRFFQMFFFVVQVFFKLFGKGSYRFYGIFLFFVVLSLAIVLVIYYFVFKDIKYVEFFVYGFEVFVGLELYFKEYVGDLFIVD